MKLAIEESIRRAWQWVEDHGYQGYEPFDGLTSYLRSLTCGSEFVERLLIQCVRQSPFNLRPVLGIRPTQSTTAVGYLAGGYLKMYQRTGEVLQRDKAVRCLEWLVENKAPSYSEFCWGNQFDFTSRGGRLARLEPTIVWSSLIGQVFLDAFEILGDERYLEISKSVCTWILGLPRERKGNGICLSYVTVKQMSVHNANMLGAAMLARTAKHSANETAREVARQAMEHSCSMQRPDGSWSYGEQKNNGWIDSFHTGYNLDSLKCYIDNTGDSVYKRELERGFQFFKGSFFEEDGKPRYYHDRTYPVDIQCAAQGIETLSKFSQEESGALDLALKVAVWTMENMQDRTGYFYYRMLPAKTIKIPMFHWGQATMLKSLASLLLEMSRN